MGKDKEAAREMIQTYKSKSVPVIVIGNEVIIGFDQDRIDAALGS